jgi:bis(5'-nucleosyl)-tetraphosphatase (symmetrical)
VIVNAMTRLRVCDDDGAMVLSFKGEPGEARGAHLPWFDMPGRASAAYTVICGHWSALGLRVSERILSLDTGCVWGRSLTAMRLSDRRLYQVRCRALAGRED